VGCCQPHGRLRQRQPRR